ncbi:SIMPL domain-containing protein [Desulfosporosinus sp. PR]|uniref:SIMPL domain-containing protein n=1 Tax=Candidatus Desulfosporosinus nitrosoreducens TaxID=3401928 RepID=UPI0027F32415|nr:SIMPL domain-containing protein [Desulfosporosinus sp. PR]MDQ7092240.1 SIMPL domain-containing protein [Desulfosporosinus sp. PR]
MKKSLKILLSVLALILLLAQNTWAAELPQAGVIETSASSSMSVDPDAVQLSLTVRTEESTSALAQEKNATAVSQAIDLLVSEGISKDSIKTTNYSTYSYTKTDSDKNASEVTVYSTNSGLEVKLTQLDKVGEILSKLAGVNEVNVNSVNYSVQDTTKYKEQLISAAIADAKQTIQYSADAAGVKLDKLNSLSVNFSSDSTVHPYVRSADSLAGAAVPQPQNPDKIVISASVTLSYTVQQ